MLKTKSESVSNKKLVLDSDGVCLDLLSMFEKRSSEFLQRPLPVLHRGHDFRMRYGLGSQELDACWDYFEETGGWKSIEPLDGAVDAVILLQREGFDIHVVTGIPPRLEEQRLCNFLRFGIRPAGIRCVGHGTASKRESITEISPLAFVDDRIEHLHDNQQVPMLVWVDHGDEQSPVPGARHDHRVASLADWVDAFLS